MLAAGWSSPPPSGTQALVSRQADGPDTQHAGAEQPCSLRLAAVGAGGHPSSHVHTREWRALCTRSDLRARTTQPHGCGAPRSPVMHDSISPTRSPQPGGPALWVHSGAPLPARHAPHPRQHQPPTRPPALSGPRPEPGFFGGAWDAVGWLAAGGGALHTSDYPMWLRPGDAAVRTPRQGLWWCSGAVPAGGGSASEWERKDQGEGPNLL